MHNENFLFDFDDLLIEPAHRTPIKSRKEVNPKRASGWMPLMTAPMDTVVTRENAFKFLKHWIVPVEPVLLLSGLNGRREYNTLLL